MCVYFVSLWVVGATKAREGGAAAGAACVSGDATTDRRPRLPATV